MSSVPPGIPDSFPRPDVSAPRQHRIPLVWLLPAIVIVVGLFVVIHAKLAEGPVIEIRFRSAEGLEPGKTRIKFKDVDVGQVTDMRVSKDRTQVIVTAAMTKDASDYLVTDTKFWVVRPRVSGGSVSGLGTLLSGAYIGVDVGKADHRAHEFVGLEVPPIVTSGLPGREFVLHASAIGSLSVGSPIFYRHLEAGQIVAYSLDPGGASVTMKVFVKAPYDQYVTGATRFWQASGIDLSLTSDGFHLRTESLATLLEGGIAFEQSATLPVTEPSGPDTVFALYADRTDAMRPADTEVRPLLMYFSDSLRGLATGAPVDLNGIQIGEVRTVSIEYDRKAGVMRFPVEVDIYPQRVRERYRAGERSAAIDDTTVEGNRVLVDSLVAHGMRAQLKTGNLLTGQKYIEMDFHPTAAKAQVDWKEQPGVFPTIPGGLNQIQDTIGSIATKIDRLPFDKASSQLIVTMQSLDSALKSTDQLARQVDSSVAPQVTATLAEAQSAMKKANALLSQDAPLQSDLSATLLDLSRAAKSVSVLADYLERHPESIVRGKAKDQQ